MSLSLKVMINKEKTKVVFAEANSDFIDVLLSFLTLPLGKIVTVLQKHPGSEEAAAIGSLSTLYKGVSELDSAHFSTLGAKKMLLNPRSYLYEICRFLAVDVAGTGTLPFFLCQNVECYSEAFNNISMYSDIAKCECGKWLNRETRVDVSWNYKGGAFVESPLVFIITDDLRVAPIVTGDFEILTDFGITDTQGTEMKTLKLGINEMRELLKLSLTSATPLTDMVMKNSVENPQYGIWSYHIHQDHVVTETRKIVLKAFLHKSTNKFLFAEASDEFVELLLSFLTMPLGGVEFLFDSNTPFKNIDNLYKSVSNGIDDKYLILRAKNELTNPKLAHGYLTTNQLLPLSEDGPPRLDYYNKYVNDYKKYIWFFYEGAHSGVSLKSSKIEFCKEQTMCFVTDDLTISTGLAARISILNDAGISISDVKETEFHIGPNEALGILKASLTSKTALTDGLIKPKTTSDDGLIKPVVKEPKKEPKTER